MNIAVFYHCLLSARHRSIPEEYALDMVMEQMSALNVSGLADAAAHISVFVNGSAEETAIVASVCDPRAVVLSHGAESNSEIPTLIEVRKWATSYPGSAILYHHTKGVSTPKMADNWRHRMETFMVWNWRDCVDRLQTNCDAVGCHWLTPESNPGAISSPFFGGNFWWARSEYVARLPLLPGDTWENRYEAESWIGRGNPRPRIFDPSPGWPTL
jgi:hypothetical protein